MEALKEAQSELEASRHRYADLYDFAPVTYVTLDRNGWISEINLTGTKLLGRERPLLINNPLSSFILKADRRILLDHLARCNAGKPNVASELRIQRKDGTIVPVQLSSNPIADTQSYRTILSDLTEQKRGEDLLKGLNRELEQQVQKRTAALLRANRALEREIIQRKQLQEDLLNVSESEKRSLGDKMHDGLCQEIAAASMMCSVVGRRVESVAKQEAEDLMAVGNLLTSIMLHAKEIARGLNPVQFDAIGLSVALEQLCQSVNRTIACEFVGPLEEVSVADNSIALNLYRIAQDAVAHAVKRTRTSRIAVRFQRKGHKVALHIEDDGDRSPLESLRLMQYHATRMGASLRVTRSPGGGTRVTCSVEVADA